MKWEWEKSGVKRPDLRRQKIKVKIKKILKSSFSSVKVCDLTRPDPGGGGGRGVGGKGEMWEENGSKNKENRW